VLCSTTLFRILLFVFIAMHNYRVRRSGGAVERDVVPGDDETPSRLERGVTTLVVDVTRRSLQRNVVYKRQQVNRQSDMDNGK